MEPNLIIALCVGLILMIGGILLWVFADPFKTAEKMDKHKEEKDKKDNKD